MSSEDAGRDADIDRALETLAEHQETIDELLDAIETFEGSGALDLLEVAGTRDEQRDELFYEVFTEDPATLRTVQNLSVLAGLFAEADPDALATTLDATAVSAEDFEAPPEVGLTGIVRQLRDPAVRRGLGTVFLLLKAVGSRPQPGSAAGPDESPPDSSE